MVEKLVPASLSRRALAVFVDFFVYYGTWIALGIAFHGSWWLVFLFLVDVVLTAQWGGSVGRWSTGIRVVKAASGERPGFLAALIRTAIVFVSGWAGLLFVSLASHLHRGIPQRMWWDSAAGTRLVSVRRISLLESYQDGANQQSAR